MPTYEYKCSSCNEEIEILQSFSDNPIKICPSCKKPDLERLFSAGGGLIFKGAGFYLTDYKSKKTEKKTENKPDTKTDSKPVANPNKESSK